MKPNLFFPILIVAFFSTFTALWASHEAVQKSKIDPAKVMKDIKDLDAFSSQIKEELTSKFTTSYNLLINKTVVDLILDIVKTYPILLSSSKIMEQMEIVAKINKEIEELEKTPVKGIDVLFKKKQIFDQMHELLKSGLKIAQRSSFMLSGFLVKYYELSALKNKPSDSSK